MNKELCGACLCFDRRNLQGQPWGRVVIDGQTYDQGVCRDEKGLMFGVLNESVQCRQPKGCSKSVPGIINR